MVCQCTGLHHNTWDQRAGGTGGQGLKAGSNVLKSYRTCETEESLTGEISPAAVGGRGIAKKAQERGPVGTSGCAHGFSLGMMMKPVSAGRRLDATGQKLQW
mmetsp:Transcript_62436/g.103705  ORF Transcript_62436/g.103705 Transcript_62436/m.103705 type:complete len:102 (-) Transcript_62436:46-351(-)